MRPISRIQPALPATDVKTYAIAAPVETHFRPATCGEVDCAAHRSGWKTTVDVGTDLGRGQAHYIRTESGRRFTEESLTGTLVTFYFEAGQRCFAQHQVRLDRPEIFLVRDGDWRGNPRGTETRIHATGEDWVDDFATHQERVADQIRRG